MSPKPRKTAVCIPYRPIDDERVANFACVKERWESFGFPVFHGDSDGDEDAMFSCSQARNRAVAQTDASVFIIADGDILLGSKEQAQTACRLALENDCYVVAFSELIVLDWEATRAVRAGADPAEQEALESAGRIWGNCFAISRTLFKRVGGFDERFIGYGHEDGAFLNACSTLGSKDRVEGVAYHLRHPAPDRSLISLEQKTQLAIRYRDADGDVEKMTTLIGERR